MSLFLYYFTSDPVNTPRRRIDAPDIRNASVDLMRRRYAAHDVSWELVRLGPECAPVYVIQHPGGATLAVVEPV